MTTYKVGYLIGSLAKESINRKLAKALVHACSGKPAILGNLLPDLPLYSYDYDADFRTGGASFKAPSSLDASAVRDARIQSLDPGRLKNAIDWASRPYGTNAFARKRPL